MTTAGGLLAGKRALVTGASRGLGRAICGVFATEGGRVAFTYTKDAEGARETLERIEAAGGEGKAYAVSVLDTTGTESMLRELDVAWGGLDVLVNNAGISQALPLALMEEEDWDRVMDVNVKGVFLTSRAGAEADDQEEGRGRPEHRLPGRREDARGSGPRHGEQGRRPGLTQGLAKEVARYGIRVNCLAPGLLDDGVGRNLPEYRLADYLKHCALGRVGTLDEVARLTAFLVSDANSYMSGETIVMDGGL